MESQSTMDKLKERNLFLRKQRLMLHNLLSIANDEIIILKKPIISKKKRVPTEETNEFFELLLKMYEDYVESCCDCLNKETTLIEKTGGIKDTEFYILELEQLLKEKMKSCEFILKVIRALRLTYN